MGAPHGWAASLPFDPSQFADPNQLITPAVRNALVKTVGLGTDHRSYEGASALGTAIGLDIGIEATMVKTPTELGPALSSIGGPSNVPPFIPVPRLHLHKGLGSRAGIAFSGVFFLQYMIYGGDFKLVLSQPEEGLTIATRLAYTRASLQIVTTDTYTPQLVVSRKLDFAEPYLGIGYQMTDGYVGFDYAQFGQSVHIGGEDVGSAKASSFIAYLGVQFKAQVVGLQLTIEGGYSAEGMHSLGTKFGFSF